MAILTTTDLKSYLGIRDGEDDARITTAVNAVNGWIVDYCGRSFDRTEIVSASARVFRPKEGCYLWVDDFWETTALAAKLDFDDDGTYETSWVLNTDYTLEPLNGLAGGRVSPYYKLVPTAGRAFPTGNRRAAVQVTAAWGWAAPPDAVLEAALIQGARIFHRKDSPQGVVGGFADFSPIRVSGRTDPDVEDALEAYRHPKIAAPMVA